MKNNTLSPHLKSTFSLAAVVLLSRHKTDAGAAEEENCASSYGEGAEPSPLGFRWEFTS